MRGRDQRRRGRRHARPYAVAGLVGLLVAPDAAPALWATLLGFSQGGLLALAFLFFSLRTSDQAQAAQLSAMAQTVGYLVAAAGPLAVGVLRDATGGWTAPIVFLLVVIVPLLVAGMAAGRSQIVYDVGWSCSTSSSSTTRSTGRGWASGRVAGRRPAAGEARAGRGSAPPARRSAPT